MAHTITLCMAVLFADNLVLWGQSSLLVNAESVMNKDLLSEITSQSLEGRQLEQHHSRRYHDAHQKSNRFLDRSPLNDNFDYILPSTSVFSDILTSALGLSTDFKYKSSDNDQSEIELLSSIKEPPNYSEDNTESRDHSFLSLSSSPKEQATRKPAYVLGHSLRMPSSSTRAPCTINCSSLSKFTDITNKLLTYLKTKSTDPSTVSSFLKILKNISESSDSSISPSSSNSSVNTLSALSYLFQEFLLPLRTELIASSESATTSDNYGDNLDLYIPLRDSFPRPYSKPFIQSESVSPDDPLLKELLISTIKPDTEDQLSSPLLQSSFTSSVPVDSSQITLILEELLSLNSVRASPSNTMPLPKFSQSSFTSRVPSSSFAVSSQIAPILEELLFLNSDQKSQDNRASPSNTMSLPTFTKSSFTSSVPSRSYVGSSQIAPIVEDLLFLNSDQKTQDDRASPSNTMSLPTFYRSGAFATTPQEGSLLRQLLMSSNLSPNTRASTTFQLPKLASSNLHTNSDNNPYELTDYLQASETMSGHSSGTASILRDSKENPILSLTIPSSSLSDSSENTGEQNLLQFLTNLFKPQKYLGESSSLGILLNSLLSKPSTLSVLTSLSKSPHAMDFLRKLLLYFNKESLNTSGTDTADEGSVKSLQPFEGIETISKILGTLNYSDSVQTTILNTMNELKRMLKEQNESKEEVKNRFNHEIGQYYLIIENAVTYLRKKNPTGGAEVAVTRTFQKSMKAYLRKFREKIEPALKTYTKILKKLHPLHDLREELDKEDCIVIKVIIIAKFLLFHPDAFQMVAAYDKVAVALALSHSLQKDLEKNIENGAGRYVVTHGRDVAKLVEVVEQALRSVDLIVTADSRNNDEHSDNVSTE